MDPEEESVESLPEDVSCVSESSSSSSDLSVGGGVLPTLKGLGERLRLRLRATEITFLANPLLDGFAPSSSTPPTCKINMGKV